MKKVVSINELSAICKSLNDLAKDYNLLMAEYVELRERNSRLKNDFELIKEMGYHINLCPE